MVILSWYSFSSDDGQSWDVRFTGDGSLNLVIAYWLSLGFLVVTDSYCLLPSVARRQSCLLGFVGCFCYCWRSRYCRICWW